MNKNYLSMLKPSLTLAVLSFCLLVTPSHAQTCAAPGKDGPASITGSVNTFYQPTAGTFTPATTQITLSNPLGSAAVVAPGDLVLIVQMQCETINSTNTSAYGANDGTGRGFTDPATGCRAGQYEYVRAGPASSGTTLDLSATPLVNTYTLDPITATNRRTFQVIRVPQFSSATLTGPVTAVPWNGVSGGIVAMDVTGNLNMNGQTIDVTGQGFRGGGGALWDAIAPSTNDFVIPTNIATNRQSMKGEGIAGTPRLVYDGAAGTVTDLGATWGGYADGDQGKGAPGNAGGGGNNFDGTRDNAGGGGGGNGGIGGFGAYGYKNVPFASGYVGERDLRGIGGAAFAQRSINRLVMGGGGGAGGANGNNVTLSSGSAGGGMVLLRSGSMSGVGTINANGAAAPNQPGNEAAGGGGAAGSVAVFSANSSLGTLTVNANGGKGGDSFLLGNTAHAGGGGGAGGVVFTSGTAAINTNGGTNGTTVATNSQNGANHGATAGAAGTSATSITGSPTGTGTGAACLPVLAVTKSTSTPVVTLPGSTTAQYSINVTNAATAGAAYGVSLRDVLPVPFGLQSVASTGTPVFSGAGTSGLSPTAANQSGNTATAVFGVGGTGNAPAVSSFTIFPGGSVTVTFVVNVNTTTLTTFQNSASATFTDPTRLTGGAATSSAVNNPVVSPGGVYASGAAVVGSNYAAGSSTAEDVTVVATTVLSVTKTNAVSSVSAGGTTTYSLTFTNSGGFAANNALIKDNPSAGLACNMVTCTSTTNGASCPSGLTLGTPTAASAVPNLFNNTGITIPTFPAASSVVLTVNCAVTATGQ